MKIPTPHRILAAALLLALAAPAAPMSNADVIKMVQASLDENIIITSVANAAEAGFDTSTDGLIALSQAKVPQTVIAAMIQRGTGAKPASAAAGADDANAFKPSEIRVLDGGGTQTMRYVNYTTSNAVRGLGWGGAASYAEIRNPQARLRLGPSPVFLVVVPEDAQPESYITLVQLGLRRGNKGRYIMLGSARGGYAVGSSSGIPADRMIETTGEKHADQTGAPKGFIIYKLAPVSPLKPAEYAIVLETGASKMTGAWFGGVQNYTFFDFGVNK
jgi:hypothetical protein